METVSDKSDKYSNMLMGLAGQPSEYRLKIVLERGEVSARQPPLEPHPAFHPVSRDEDKDLFKSGTLDRTDVLKNMQRPTVGACFEAIYERPKLALTASAVLFIILYEALGISGLYDPRSDKYLGKDFMMRGIFAILFVIWWAAVVSMAILGIYELQKYIRLKIAQRENEVKLDESIMARTSLA